MQDNVLISVIIPTYRRYDMLCEAVQSVVSQSYQNIEIIVIDDCSNDDTYRIAESFPQITYLCNQRNSGPGYGRLQGLLHSRGEYVVFLDDDDFYTDMDFYKKAAEHLKNDPDCIFVAANAVIYYEETGEKKQNPLNVHGEMLAVDYLEGFPFANKKPHSTFTTVFRKNALLEAEVDKMEMVNDIPIYMRCLTAGGKVHFLEDEIGIYRIHDSNISKAMTADFILANLKEKAAVLDRIKQLKLFPSYNNWWYGQVNGTLQYYVYGSQPGLSEYKKVEKWILSVSEEKTKIKQLCKQLTAHIRYCRICAIKRGTKRLLRIKA